MGGIFSWLYGSAPSSPKLTGIPIQTSIYGKAIPVYFGTARGAPNLIDYLNFVGTRQSQGSKGGVVGGAAGKGATTYTYTAAVVLAWCEGPIYGFGQAWASKTPTDTSTLGLTEFLGNYAQAAWSYLTSNYPSHALGYSGIAYAASPNLDLGNSAQIPNNNVEIYGFFSQRVVYTVTNVPGSGPYTVTPGNRTWAELDGDGNPVVVDLWVSDAGVVGPHGPMTFVVGIPSSGQYAVVNGVYTFAAADANNAITIAWLGNGQDADPALIVQSVLTNPNFGVGFPSNRFGEPSLQSETHTIPSSPYQVVVNFNSIFNDNLSVAYSGGALLTCVAGSPAVGQYSYNTSGVYTFAAADAGKSVLISYMAVDTTSPFYTSYIWAAGLFLSPSYTDQTTASQLIANIALITNSEVVWSGGFMRLVPRGDMNLTANGHSYIAPAAALLDLTDDLFQPVSGSTQSSSATGDSPVAITRLRKSDQINDVQIEFLDRAYQYNANTAEATDQYEIDSYGKRTSGGLSQHEICDATVAKTSVQLQLQKQAIRNQYAFALDERYAFLDAMDIVTITDAAIGLNKQWVRILTATEQGDGTIQFQAEEYLNGNASAASYDYGTTSGYSGNYNIPPGDVNAPVVFEMPVQLATNSGLEAWCAISSNNPNWAGADVWVSSDNVTYNLVGRQTGAARMGALTASFASGSDPDTTDTLSVNLTESNGQLVSGTQSDADLWHTLALVDGELISYETVSLTSAYHYNIGTYIRRGVLGTAIASHNIGAPFTRLDDSVFVIPYDKSQIGQTIYMKFCSFNHYGGGLQDLSEVTAYTHTIASPPLPGTVQNFTILQVGLGVVLGWTDLDDVSVKGYDILYGVQGDVIANATLLTEASRTTETTTDAVGVGAWTFYIRARNIADATGPVSSANVTISAFAQEFDANGTWTKPGGITSSSRTHVECWAGGGGGNTTGAGAGGGGAYLDAWFNTSSLSSTESVTIGSGGVSGVSATAGGSTSFGSLITSYGGGPAQQGGGGGGGALGAGGSAASLAGGQGGSPDGGAPASGATPGGDSSFGGGGGGNYTTNAGANGGNSVYGGGGGAGGEATSPLGVGGNSVYGGGGGSSATGTAGGSSVFGGNGGAPGVAGSAPGGGGGSNAAGAHGRVIVTVFP